MFQISFIFLIALFASTLTHYLSHRGFKLKKLKYLLILPSLCYFFAFLVADALWSVAPNSFGELTANVLLAWFFATIGLVVSVKWVQKNVSITIVKTAIGKDAFKNVRWKMLFNVLTSIPIFLLLFVLWINSCFAVHSDQHGFFLEIPLGFSSFLLTQFMFNCLLPVIMLNALIWGVAGHYGSLQLKVDISKIVIIKFFSEVAKTVSKSAAIAATLVMIVRFSKFIHHIRWEHVDELGIVVLYSTPHFHYEGMLDTVVLLASAMWIVCFIFSPTIAD